MYIRHLKYSKAYKQNYKLKREYMPVTGMKSNFLHISFIPLKMNGSIDARLCHLSEDCFFIIMYLYIQIGWI